MTALINHRLRVALQDGESSLGQLIAFDKHMNLVLSDCEEFRRTKKASAISSSKKKALSQGLSPSIASLAANMEERRNLAYLCFVEKTSCPLWLNQVHLQTLLPPCITRRSKWPVNAWRNWSYSRISWCSLEVLQALRWAVLPANVSQTPSNAHDPWNITLGMMPPPPMMPPGMLPPGMMPPPPPQFHPPPS